MRKIIILFCFIFCISCSQRKADSNKVVAEQQKAADSPFNPALRKAIDEFIDYVESKKGRPGKVYLIWSRKVDEIPVLILDNDYYYYTWHQYYYIDGDHLIIYMYPWDENDYQSGMIDVSKMTEFRDSIPGFDHVSKIDMEYNPSGRVFRIISPDSLRIIYTGKKAFDDKIIRKYLLDFLTLPAEKVKQ